MTLSKFLNIAADRDQNASQLVRSAAYSLQCPLAAFYGIQEQRLVLKSVFGFSLDHANHTPHAVLGEALRQGGDQIFIIDDVARHPNFTADQSFMFGRIAGPIRFLAAACVCDTNGVALGLLVVANHSPHSGLTPAKRYVLQTHAMQLAVVAAIRELAHQEARSETADPRWSNTDRLRLLESVVVNCNDAVLITEAEPIDLPGPRIVYCNAAFERATGYSEAEVLGKTPRMLQTEKTNRAALDRLRQALETWRPIEIELLNARKDGTQFWVELSIVPVANETGWFTHWISVQRDVSSRKMSEESATRTRITEAQNLVLETEVAARRKVQAKLAFAAFHDDLTKLHNRAYLMGRLVDAMNDTKHRAGGSRYALLFMDLDRFKLVNDSLGHRAGDVLLLEVARRLEHCMAAHHTLARMGGDEFALLIEGEDACAERLVVDVAKRIVNALRPPIWLGDQEIFCTCSMGILIGTDQYKTPEDVLRDADLAMYQAKRNDTGSYAVYASTIPNVAMSKLTLQTDLKNAIMRGEFFLDYQPICDARTQAIAGAEALLRWRHPTRGVVPPADFIPLAEETGLIRDIGRWVIQAACLQMRRWLDKFPAFDLRLSINASADEVMDPRFQPALVEALTTAGVEPTMLQVEVTESVFLRNPEEAGRVLENLRALGIRIALDDFGTGYSSLSYLDRFEMDAIKIDRSFVDRMLTHPRTMAIIDAILALGQSMQIDIVAEGVENPKQLRALQASNCDYVQGYLLGRPVSGAMFEKLLAAQRSGPV